MYQVQTQTGPSLQIVWEPLSWGIRVPVWASVCSHSDDAVDVSGWGCAYQKAAWCKRKSNGLEVLTDLAHLLAAYQLFHMAQLTFLVWACFLSIKSHNNTISNTVGKSADALWTVALLPMIYASWNQAMCFTHLYGHGAWHSISNKHVGRRDIVIPGSGLWERLSGGWRPVPHILAASTCEPSSCHQLYTFWWQGKVQVGTLTVFISLLSFPCSVCTTPLLASQSLPVFLSPFVPPCSAFYLHSLR